MNTYENKRYSFLNDLVYRYAEQAIERLIRKACRELRAIKVTTSGDDSILKNCWDEICAQLQGELFLGWSFYERTMQSIVKDCYNELSENDKLFINYLVIQTEDDIYEQNDYSSIYSDAIEKYLLQRIKQIALNYTNSRIRAYLDHSVDFN